MKSQIYEPAIGLNIHAQTLTLKGVLLPAIIKT